jgi:hypothetical protein
VVIALSIPQQYSPRYMLYFLTGSMGRIVSPFRQFYQETVSDLAHATTFGTYNYTGIDRTLRAFLEKTDTGPPIYTLTPQKARAVLDALRSTSC